MAKFSEMQQKMIAALRNAGRSVESLKEQFGATARQIKSYAEKYKDDDTFTVTKTTDKNNSNQS